MAFSQEASAFLERLFVTPYHPKPELRTFLSRAETQECSAAEVTVAVLDAKESSRAFGVPLSRRGIQPVYLRIENRSGSPLRLQLLSINPNYFTGLEAAGASHFSIARRLGAFGFISWLFLPLLALVPFKLITAYRANRRMDDVFRLNSFRLHPIPPGEASEGFVFTPLDAGVKVVHISLHGAKTFDTALVGAHAAAQEPGAELTFTMPAPGLDADFTHRDLATIHPPGSAIDCDVATLVEHLREMPAATSNRSGTRAGDPTNLVVIGEFETLISAFAARWDESETISVATCWKTVRAFLLGSQYRYSPVSPLYLFGRSQDVALQRCRRSINERLHLRLWLTPLRCMQRPVWIGQVSRDIGVRFTLDTWNLTTHRVDPEVDEARDYVIEDLLQAERTEASGYLDGVGPCERSAPRHNLTGDPYYTDGKRAVILLSALRTKPQFVAWR